MSQLKDRELYGEEGSRTLATNHMVQIIYAPREQQDAQEYSEILGYYGLNSTSKGVSRGRGSVTNSENVSEQKRALMLPQELREIGPDRIDIFFSGPFGIGIIDAQQKSPPRPARQHPIMQCGADIADMKIASGRRGEAGDCHAAPIAQLGQC